MLQVITERDDQYVLNHCTKYLARTNVDSRHNFGQYAANDYRGCISEAWRFPIIDSFRDGTAPENYYRFNTITFVYTEPARPQDLQVEVVGSFYAQYQPIPLRQVEFAGEKTGIYAHSVVLPKGRTYTYKYLVNGKAVLDPINPQQAMSDNGRPWSRFFTNLCTDLITLERWEADILARLTEHILPFRTREGQRFLDYYYSYLDKTEKERQYSTAYRLDQPVGIVNFIDKILAREEGHRLIDYRICLSIIDGVLRAQVPRVDPCDMSKEVFVTLYDQMAADNVPNWDKGRYGSPGFFLQLLRRHAYTGAFSHPKYGGNTGALGWRYLTNNFQQPSGETAFNWARAVEQPLGESDDYHG